MLTAILGNQRMDVEIVEFVRGNRKEGRGSIY